MLLPNTRRRIFQRKSVRYVAEVEPLDVEDVAQVHRVRRIGSGVAAEGARGLPVQRLAARHVLDELPLQASRPVRTSRSMPLVPPA